MGGDHLPVAKGSFCGVVWMESKAYGIGLEVANALTHLQAMSVTTANGFC